VIAALTAPAVADLGSGPAAQRNACRVMTSTRAAAGAGWRHDHDIRV